MDGVCVAAERKGSREYKRTQVRAVSLERVEGKNCRREVLREKEREMESETV